MKITSYNRLSAIQFTLIVGLLCSSISTYAQLHIAPSVHWTAQSQSYELPFGGQTSDYLQQRLGIEIGYRFVDTDRLWISGQVQAFEAGGVNTLNDDGSLDGTIHVAGVGVGALIGGKLGKRIEYGMGPLAYGAIAPTLHYREIKTSFRDAGSGSAVVFGLQGRANIELTRRFGLSLSYRYDVSELGTPLNRSVTPPEVFEAAKTRGSGVSLGLKVAITNSESEQRFGQNAYVSLGAQTAVFLRNNRLFAGGESFSNMGTYPFLMMGGEFPLKWANWSYETGLEIAYTYGNERPDWGTIHHDLVTLGWHNYINRQVNNWMKIGVGLVAHKPLFAQSGRRFSGSNGGSLIDWDYGAQAHRALAFFSLNVKTEFSVSNRFKPFIFVRHDITKVGTPASNLTGLGDRMRVNALGVGVKCLLKR